jgi:glycolate oxidase iron-sulfur subunit
MQYKRNNRDIQKELGLPNQNQNDDTLIESARANLLAEASRCVSCGLCLPHCPTYRITLSEADSPRGRIAMISGVANERIPMNDRFKLHIDRCLTCRACEVACPNHVAFGRIIDEARSLVSVSSVDLSEKEVDQKKRGLRAVLERVFIAKPSRFDLIRPFIRLFQITGLQAGLQRLGFVKGTPFALLLSKLPSVHRYRYKWRAVYPAVGVQRGAVALFLGCVARLIDTETNLAAIFVLNRLGYTVHVPRTQTCCGALYQHSGRMDEAKALILQNKQAFADLKIDAIISTASGCGAHLVERSAQQPMEGFSAPVMDINQFLVEQDWSDVSFAPLPKKVAVHDPCTLRNVLRAASLPYQLLSHIPEIEVVALAGNHQCCGAAGTYFLDQPEIAESLLNEKIAALTRLHARYLVTSNIGCALHIASGLQHQKRQGSVIEVLHPVTLLARQMAIP